MIEVVVPSLRQGGSERLVRSLAMGTVKPDLVSIVSNEVQPWADPGVPTRLLRFSSDRYAIGEWDVALRQNVGIWAAIADVIVINGDDQVASRTMIEDSLRVLGDEPCIWGNHRLVDFFTRDPLDLVDMPPEAGQSRETPPNDSHSFLSCYGGMLVARTAFLRKVGGFDMAFNGRHGGEDQALGYRILRAQGKSRVFIYEPPYSWHPIELVEGSTQRQPWLPPLRNGCEPGTHALVADAIDGVAYVRCTACNYWHFPDDAMLCRDTPFISYDHSAVTVEEVRLS